MVKEKNGKSAACFGAGGGSSTGCIAVGVCGRTRKDK